MGSWKQGWSGPGEIPCESLCPKTGLLLAEICRAYSLACSVTVAWACPKELFFFFFFLQGLEKEQEQKKHPMESQSIWELPGAHSWQL